MALGLTKASDGGIVPETKRIGILTSGGDCAGLNAVIRAVATHAVFGYGWPYLAGIAAAAGIAVWHGLLIRTRTREGCFRAFRLNHWLGFTVFTGVVVQHALAAA